MTAGITVCSCTGGSLVVAAATCCGLVGVTECVAACGGGGAGVCACTDLAAGIFAI